MMAVAMSLIGLIDGIAKYGAAHLHGLQVTWIYFVSMLFGLLVALVLYRGQIPFALRATQPGLQCLRALCMVGSLSLLFTGLTWLPLAEATVISFTSPLFMVALAGPILNERVTRRHWAAVCTGLVGSLLVIRPGSNLFQWAALLPLAGAVFFSLFNIVTRQIGASDSVFTTLFYTFTIGALALCLPLPLIWQTPGISTLLALSAAGAMGVVAHLLIARALQITQLAIVAPLNYVRLIWALGLGYWWFGDLPDSLAFVGAILIVGSGVYAVVSYS